MTGKKWVRPLKPDMNVEFLRGLIFHFGHDGGAIMGQLNAQLSYIKHNLNSQNMHRNKQIFEEVLLMNRKLKELGNLFDVLMNVLWQGDGYSKAPPQAPLEALPLFKRHSHNIRIYGSEKVPWGAMPRIHNCLDILLYALSNVSKRTSIDLICVFADLGRINFKLTKHIGRSKDSSDLDAIRSTLASGSAHFGFQLDYSQLEASGRASLVFAVEIEIENW